MDKATFLETLHTARAEWEALLSEVGEPRMLEPGATGEWSVKDVIAHIIEGEREMIRICETHALVESELWNMTMTDDERNPIIVSWYRDHTPQAVLAEEQQVYARLLTLLQTLSDEDLNDPQRFRDMPLDRVPWKVIAGDSFDHYRSHMPDIRAWLDVQ
ncbi:MAG: DinB family protein [Ktedonobacteraceae bacterium]